ncbi:MAG: DUF1573 domain-containing protein [Candidatus Omnitrophica bacterium]|nr:DUF1573 domain-containing protein [Candidatus Omnitrophota bacterium]
MKKVIIIIICFFVFVLMLKMIACQSQIETNVFSINESRKRSQKIEIPVDFGIVTDGQVKEKQFYLLNQTEKVFKVNEFRPSCGCTSMIIDATTVFISF